MVALAAGIDADDELVTLDSDLTASQGDLFTIGTTEIVAFRQYWSPFRFPRQINRRKVFIARGERDTVPASHLSGAVLEAFSDLTGGGGGGGVTVTGSQSGEVAGATSLLIPGTVVLGDPGQAVVGLVVQQIGPLTINFNTAGEGGTLYKDGGSVVVGDELPSGCFIIDAWPVVSTPFGGTIEAAIIVAANDLPDENGAELSRGWLVGQGDASSVADFNATGQQSDGLRYVVKVNTANVKLGSWLKSSLGTAVAGSLDLYAIIATPVV